MPTLKQLLDSAGMTGAELARRVGAAQPEIWRLLNPQKKNGRKMTKEWAERLAPALNVRPEDLLFPSKAKPKHAYNSDGERIDIPDGGIGEIDGRAGLGGGQSIPEAYGRTGVVDAFKPEAWFFPPAFVRSGFKAPVSKIIAIETQGESMAPTNGNYGSMAS